MLGPIKNFVRSAMPIAEQAFVFADWKLGGVAEGVRYKLGRSISSRERIPLLLRHLGHRGVGVEVGVFEGFFSELILKYSHLSCLYSIDPWREFEPEKYVDVANSPQPEHDRRYQMTCDRLKKFGGRSKVLRMTSEEAQPRFEDSSLDFVYIDANHSYEGCKEDLELWWPKLKPGGLFAGDDYYGKVYRDTSYGVEQAVIEFSKRVKQDFFLTKLPRGAHWPNWYLVKN